MADICSACEGVSPWVARDIFCEAAGALPLEDVGVDRADAAGCGS